MLFSISLLHRKEEREKANSLHYTLTYTHTRTGIRTHIPFFLRKQLQVLKLYMTLSNAFPIPNSFMHRNLQVLNRVSSCTLLDTLLGDVCKFSRDLQICMLPGSRESKNINLTPLIFFFKSLCTR